MIASGEEIDLGCEHAIEDGVGHLIDGIMERRVEVPLELSDAALRIHQLVHAARAQDHRALELLGPIELAEHEVADRGRREGNRLCEQLVGELRVAGYPHDDIAAEVAHVVHVREDLVACVVDGLVHDHHVIDRGHGSTGGGAVGARARVRGQAQGVSGLVPLEAGLLDLQEYVVRYYRALEINVCMYCLIKELYRMLLCLDSLPHG